MKIKKLDLDLIQQIKGKEVRAKRRVLSRTLEGSWTTMLKGRGMEFAGFRKYTYGDDASKIDWGASLRAKETLIREFEEFRSVNVVFLLDVSDSMLFTSQKKLKAEYGAELTFNLGTAILDNGDAVGYMMFANEVLAREMPGIGKEITYSMVNAFSNPKNYGGRKDFKNVVNILNAMMKQRALIVVVSDFVGLDEGWERYVRMLAEKYDLIGIMLRDPRDNIMPYIGSQFVVEDPSTDDKIFIDTKKLSKIYKKYADEEEAHVKAVFSAAKAGFISLKTDADLIEPILYYFRQRTAIMKG